MKKNLWRMLTALIISSAGFFGTVIWFNMGKQDGHSGDRTPVARLNDSSNEVQRKPLKRVIWESINRNDELFPGEAVRTAPNADARLFFIKSGAIVHLEPDSLVVLEENDKGLSLDFLQGNLFVQSQGAGGKDGGEGLTLKTGSGEIKLKSADMSLSKAQNGSVNLEVLRGEAELAQNGKATALNKDKSAVIKENGAVSVANDRVQLLKPQAGETLYLNLAKGDKVDLAWKPLAAGYHVSVEVGAQRSSMAALAGAQAGGEAGLLSFTHKPGQWYLRLKATSDDPKLPPLASMVIPFKIEPKSPPSLIEPRQEAQILKPALDAQTVFKWVARNKFQSQTIEISADPQFKNVKARESFNDDTMVYAAKLDDGNYFWRVTGFLKIKDKVEPLTSPVGKFTLASKIEIKAPILASPANDLHIPYADAQKSGVQLKWLLPKGVDSFKVSVERKTDQGWKPVYDQGVETTQVRFSEIKPGQYRWNVASVDPRGGANKLSDSFTFTVEDMVRIEWVETTPPGEYEFHTPAPTFSAHWKAPAQNPSIYRYKIAAEGKPLESEEWHTTRQDLFDVPVVAEGKYQTQVEALNAKGQTFAQSEVKIFEVKRRPLLPAPIWAANMPPTLKSDGKGNLTLGWNEVPGAQKYIMVLESPEGKVVDQREVSRNIASLQRLKPGQYKVHLKAIDDFKRPGNEGEVRPLEVPNASDIKAPKIKAMKVK